MARGEDGKVLAQCSENQAGECTLLYRGGDGNGQRTELAWAAEVVGGGPSVRPSPLRISHEKVFVQLQVAAMPFPSPLPLGDALGTKATFSPMTSQGLLHHPTLAGHLQISPYPGLPHRLVCYHC